MKELDLLKKHWQESKNFPKVSVDEIHKMIRKKSSSIVLWILIISVVEFLLLNALNLLVLENPSNRHRNSLFIADFIVDNIDYLAGFISVVFIILFYLNYRKICVADNTSALMKQIIRTKKTVNYYIYTNLGLFIIAFILVFIQVMGENKSFTTGEYLIGVGIVVVVCSVFLGVLYLYYRLVYGLLIKKLMKNHKELEKIEY